MPKNSMSAGHSFEIWQRTPSGEQPTYEMDRWQGVEMKDIWPPADMARLHLAPGFTDEQRAQLAAAGLMTCSPEFFKALAATVRKIKRAARSKKQ